MPIMIREGFPRQRQVVLPRPVVTQQLRSTRGQLVLSDIGYYPQARYHYLQRDEPLDQMIVLCCLAGHGWCDLDERIDRPRIDRIHPNQILLIPEGRIHRYGSDHPEWTIFWFHIAGAGLADLRRMVNWSRERPTIDVPDIAPLALGAEEMLSIYERGYGQRSLATVSLLAHGWFGRFATLAGQTRAESPTAERRVDELVETMRTRLRESLSLRDLAELAGLSTSQFSSIFRSRTGYSPVDYMIRLRLSRAAWLLDSTQLSIKEIAAEVGYDDPLYFSRRFSSVYRTSPRAYREIKKG